MESSDTRVAQAVLDACRLEIQALKPGNVSVYADGHGMAAADFLRSAECVVPILAQPGLTVGERILCSVQSSWAAVGCNTNLGIVLLAAPLCQATLTRSPGEDLPAGLRRVLAGLDVNDASLCFQAISLANPGGLGETPIHEVHQPAQVSLMQAMAAAADRDRIAFQYAHDYADVFGSGLPTLRHYRTRGYEPEWIAVGLYLCFLSSFHDSHVARKYGIAAAEDLRQRALPVEKRFKACENPASSIPWLLEFDQELKQEGINPGTSADLTVTTLLAEFLG